MAALAHLGVGLAAKRVAPTVPVVVLVIAALAIDLVWAVFWLAGLEQYAGDAGAGHPAYWSHSLFMAVVWSSLAGVVAWLIRRKRRLALIIGLLVFSHWVVDFITQPMTHAFPGSVGPPLLFEGSPTVGLGLYRTALGQNLGEYGTLAAGIVIYVLTLRKIRRERQPAGAPVRHP